MSTEAVQMRLAWIKAWQAARSRDSDEIDQLNNDTSRR